MKIAIPAEIEAGEPRVAATPDTVKKLKSFGADVAVEPGAGVKSGILDADYTAAGATVSADATKDADVVLKVRRPTDAELSTYKKGAVVIAIMDPYGNEAALNAMAQAGVIAFAMELMPRITRAQSMDVLSSQANLAGYRAVIDGAAEYGRALPMMMTAAGTVPAAKVFVMGVGVAGLQAIATARRLGAVVTATDVRPATKEQVESLGAKFLAVEDDEFKNAQTAGGYAKEMSKEYQAKQAALVADHIKKQDIVITTALIPGRPAPRLVTADMVKSMKPGSVLVDLAVERGGNVEGAKAGEIATVGDVKILGYLNVPGRLAATASALYAKNLVTFLEILIDKATKALAINWDDEIVKGTALTRDGTVIHPSFRPKDAPAPPVVSAASEPAPKPTPAPPTDTAPAPEPPAPAPTPMKASESPAPAPPAPEPPTPSTSAGPTGSFEPPKPSAPPPTPSPTVTTDASTTMPPKFEAPSDSAPQLSAPAAAPSVAPPSPLSTSGTTTTGSEPPPVSSEPPVTSPSGSADATSPGAPPPSSSATNGPSDSTSPPPPTMPAA